MPAPAPNPRIPVLLAFEDDDLLVAVKDRGIVTRPGRGHDRDSLMNGLVAREGDRLLELGERRDYGLLHRLDRATSGLVAVARTALAYDRLRDAFAGRRVEKVYLAIVRSAPPRPVGTVRVRLKEARLQDHKVAVVDARGEEAITHWKTLAVARDGRAIVACRIETGRLHQIRAHLAWLGCPLVSDAVYAGPRAPDGRGSSARAADREILLHAWRLRFRHPRTNVPVEVETPPPGTWSEATRGFGISLAAILRRAADVAPRR